ncbi:DUF4861 domain-containing protein [Bacteroides sp. OttesenSCG-928-D19]|nr:DUF4861 domain-containing protein [Bacteroides sp. OttesenSCG-928-D19]
MKNTLFTHSIVIMVLVLNSWEHNKTDAPVCIPINELGLPFAVQSAVITSGDTEIPYQLDDLNADGQADELAFVLDLPAHSSRTLQITLSDEAAANPYPSRVYAQMLLRGDKGKHQHIQSLTVPGSSDIYNLLHHHGPAFESELVAYRIYFDRKQTVDIYGKFNRGLEVEESQFYPTDEQLARGFGDDVLRVSGSAGLGTLKGWNGKKAIHIEPVSTRTETVLATGPVRTIVDVDVAGWQYQESLLNMKVRYILYAGHRDCQVQVSFDRPLGNQEFSAGIQNIKGSTHYSNGRGLLACWGTDWPVNDTIKYAKETVGLAIALPQEIVKKEHHDAVNYQYVVGAEGETSFTYHISFTSTKETFGYPTPQAWFEHVRLWRQELDHPISIDITKQSNKDE